MKNKDIETLVREFFTRMKKTGVNQAGIDKLECISAESICDYLEDQLSTAEKKKVEKHLSLCFFCRKMVTRLATSESPSKKGVRERIKSKVEKGVEKVKISIGWIKGHLVLKDTDADYLPFWNELKPVLVRSGSQKKPPSLPSFFKTFEHFEVRVQIIEEEGNKCEIQCRIFPLSEGKKGTNILVDLVEEGRILYSFPLEENTVIFHGVLPGDYNIEIKEKDQLLGELSISIK